MKVSNLANLSTAELAELVKELGEPQNLAQVLAWANSRPQGEFCLTVISEVIVQDEFTHDCIVPYKKFYLVFDTT